MAEGNESAKGTLGLGRSGIRGMEGILGDEELESVDSSGDIDGRENAIARRSSLSRP